ncbi:MAG: glycosyltransferase family 4 protein [Candidatus Berkelbacteria bacterium]|nr:MAG: glycosyltransferase family 4 protein [Candidatus Berkelbacteria bacterium]QQG51670.1 MAG: glycosyltransferase family 4 protein [Candidatus Berkelbacteria bacterium]
MNARVLMLLSNPFNPDERVMREATALGKAGCEVTILAWDREGRFPQDEVFPHFRVERLRYRSPYGTAAMGKLVVFNLKLFWRIFRHPSEIIHCHDFDTLLPGYFAGRLSGRKVVYDAHEYYGGMVRGISQSGFITRLSRLVDGVEAFLVRHVDAVITVVPWLLERYESLGARRTITIYNAKDLKQPSQDAPEVKALRTKLGLKAGDFVYLYAGLYDQRRALDLQIAAFKKPKFRSLNLVTVGFERDLTIKELKAKAGASPNIKILPGVPVTQFWPYLAVASAVDVIHNPSDPNFVISMPNKFFEAVAAGRPMITTEGLFIADLVKKHRAGLVIPFNDQAAFEKALDELSTDHELYHKLANGAQQLGEREYNWATNEERLVKFYRDLQKKVAK